MDISSRVWNYRQVVWVTLLLVLVAISFWLTFYFGHVIFYIFVAIIIGTVLRPLVTWLYMHRVPRMAGIILVYLLIFAFLTGFMLLLFPIVAEQSGKIVAAWPEYYQNFRNGLVNFPNPLISQISMYLPVTIPLIKPVQQTGQQQLASVESMLGYAASATQVIFTALVIFLLSIEWTLYGPRTIQSFMLLIPGGPRERIRETILMMEAKVSAFVTGQAIMCLTIGIMAMIAYLLIGLPNALVLALIAGVLEAVPMFGPVLGAIPAAVIALSISPVKLIWVVAATIVIQQAENNLLVPRIMHRAVGVNPFVTLLSLLAFSSLFGVPGALMAIPIAAIIQLLLDRYIFDLELDQSQSSIGRDYAGRLRYEAQELVQDLRKHTRSLTDEAAIDVTQVDQVIDELEAITLDLDAVLAQAQDTEVP